MESLISKGLKEGDKVQCNENGKGVVFKIKEGAYLYPIGVLFLNENEQWYTAYGELGYGSMINNLGLE